MTDALRMPHNAEAEQSVLGSILIDNTALDRLAWLTPADFYQPRHRIFFEAMLGLRERQVEIDLVTLKEAVAGDFDDAAAISSLVDSIPDVRNVEQYAQIVKDKARLRKLVTDALTLAATAQDAKAPEDVADAAARLTEASAGYRAEQPISQAQLISNTMRHLEKQAASGQWITGVPSGIRTIDGITLGFQKCEQVIIGARPSMGKTALALQIVRHVASRGYHVLFVQLDMGERAIGKRLLAAESGVSLFKIRTGQGLSDEEWKAIVAASGRLAQGGAYYGFRASDVREVVAGARRMRRMLKGLDLIVVDHIGHVAGVQRNSQRYAEVGEVSRRLMLLANELDAASLVMAQLNRDAADSEPTLSTLRESGNLEQDARVVLLLDRQWFRGERTEDVGGVEQPIPACRLNVIVAKNSEGESGQKEELHFDLTKQRIEPKGDARCSECMTLEV